MQAADTGLQLKPPLQVRLISWLITISGYIFIALLLKERVLFFGLLIWTSIQARAFFYAPAMTVYSSGIETSRFGVRCFTHWREIEQVRVGEYTSQIYPKNIHPLIKYLFYSYLMIMAWRSNYKEAMQVVKNNVEQAQENLPRRVYE